MILVNFKMYPQSFGDGAVKLARICKEVSEESKVEIIPVVSSLDAYRIIKELEIKVFIQHIDNYHEGQKTGHISPVQAKAIGISGSLVNHSERRLKPGTIKGIIKNIPKDFCTVLCVGTLGQARGWAKNIKPSYIAYEPKYLIANKEKSVATEKPAEIKKMVKLFSSIPVLVGAGVKDEEDVRTSLQLGAKGVLVSSAIVTADDPKAELSKLVKAFNV